MDHPSAHPVGARARRVPRSYLSRSHHSRSRRVGALVVVLTIAGGAGACGKDATVAAPTTTPPVTTSVAAATSSMTEAPATSAPTTAPISTDEAEVRATIDRYWDAWFKAVANPPNPDSPELNAVLTGDAWQGIVGFIRGMKDQRQYIRLPPDSQFRREIRSVSIDDRGIAIVIQCVVDDTELVSSVTSETIEDELTTSEFRSTLKHYPEGWRITTSQETSKLKGRAGCAA